MKSIIGKFFSSKNHQPGVTLLLGILLLSAILAISFSLSTVIFIEVRSSGDLLKTEGALYGATGLGEQAFFNLIRKVSSPTYYTLFDNNVSLNGPPEVSGISTPIFSGKILTNATFTSTDVKYDFCGSVATTSGCSFGKVTVTYIPTNSGSDSLYAYLCQWDPNSFSGDPCTVEGESYWQAPSEPGGAVLTSAGSVQLTPTTNPIVSWTLDPNLQQELVFTNPSGVSNIYFSVATYAVDGVTPKGLPYVGKTAVIVNTQNGSVGRKIQVTVPNR